MAIKAEHINYLYGEGTAFEQYALKDVSFEIQDGEFVGLMGHTGSGKSFRCWPESVRSNAESA